LVQIFKNIKINIVLIKISKIHSHNNLSKRRWIWNMFVLVRVVTKPFFLNSKWLAKNILRSRQNKICEYLFYINIQRQTFKTFPSRKGLISPKPHGSGSDIEMKPSRVYNITNFPRRGGEGHLVTGNGGQTPSWVHHLHIYY